MNKKWLGTAGILFLILFTSLTFPRTKNPRKHPQYHLMIKYDKAARFDLRRGFYDEALINVKKAMSLSIEIDGKDSIGTAQLYNTMGIIYRKAGKYEEAIEAHKKSTKIFILTVGKEHYFVAMNYRSFAEIYKAKGEYEKAIEYYNRSQLLVKKGMCL